MAAEKSDFGDENTTGESGQVATAPVSGGSTLEVLPPSVSEEVIDAVVSELNGLARVHGLELTLAIGRVVVEHVYKGDMKLFRARHEKDASLRKLAERADAGSLHVSAAGLYRAIAIFELTERLGVSSWKHLGVSHLRAVLGLSFPKQQKLLATAEDQAWTCDELEAAAKAARTKAGGTPRGRRPSLPFVKSIGRMEKLLIAPEEAFAGLDRVDTLAETEATRLYQAVTGMKIKCEELQAALARRIPRPT